MTENSVIEPNVSQLRIFSEGQFSNELFNTRHYAL